MVIASTFGRSGLVDAYRSSYLLINFGNQLFAAFLLPHLVVPVMSRYRECGKEEDAWRIALGCGNVVGLLGLALAVLTWTNPDAVANMLAPGLADVSRGDLLLLLRACALAFAVTLWSGVIAGILQVYRSFSLPSSTLMLANALVLCSIAFIGRRAGAKAIAGGITAGFASMLIIYLVALGKTAHRARVSISRSLLDWRYRETFRVIAGALPLLTIVAFSIAGGVIVNRNLSLLGAGTVAQFGYGIKLLILPGFVPTALATVLFPSLAAAHVRDGGERFTQLSSRAIKMTLLVSSAISAWLFCLKEPLIRLLFGRGAMDGAALKQVALLYGILLLQSPPAALNALLLKISFARGETRIAAALAALSGVLFFSCFGLFTITYQDIGAAAAYSGINTVVPALYLAYQIKRIHVIKVRDLSRFVVSTAILCAALMVGSRFTAHLFGDPSEQGVLMSIATLAISGTAGLAIAWVVARLLGMQEAKDLERYFMWRFRVPGARQLPQRP